jgi:hypothetical protein
MRVRGRQADAQFPWEQRKPRSRATLTRFRGGWPRTVRRGVKIVRDQCIHMVPLPNRVSINQGKPMFEPIEVQRTERAFLLLTRNAASGRIGLEFNNLAGDKSSLIGSGRPQPSYQPNRRPLPAMAGG